MTTRWRLEFSISSFHLSVVSSAFMSSLVSRIMLYHILGPDAVIINLLPNVKSILQTDIVTVKGSLRIHIIVLKLRPEAGQKYRFEKLPCGKEKGEGGRGWEKQAWRHYIQTNVNHPPPVKYWKAWGRASSRVGSEGRAKVHTYIHS